MKRLIFCVALLASPVFAQQDQMPQLLYPNEDVLKIPQAVTYLLVIGDKRGLLVSIKPDGTLEYGKDYTPDAAAKVFWEAMAAEAARVCK